VVSARWSHVFACCLQARGAAPPPAPYAQSPAGHNMGPPQDAYAFGASPCPTHTHTHTPAAYAPQPVALEVGAFCDADPAEVAGHLVWCPHVVCGYMRRVEPDMMTEPDEHSSLDDCAGLINSHVITRPPQQHPRHPLPTPSDTRWGGSKGMPVTICHWICHPRSI
jgi:hypothetical protein